jgi:hypothetical protein
MNKIKKQIGFYGAILLMSIAGSVQAQDVSINILNQPSSVPQLATTGRVYVDVCNNDGGATNAAVGKLRPSIQFPTSITGASVIGTGLTGWNIISNDGITIVLENTTAIAPGECSQIILGYTGVSLGGPSTVTGTLTFNGTAPFGNLTGNDVSTTSITVLLDTDGDLVADVVDLDDDNDGILDTVEDGQLSADSDGDGIPNRLDLDSDNDGINDIIEAGGVDANADGIADGTPSPTGIPLSAGTGTTPLDTDGDLRANPYDLDSDNDGINDIVESGNLLLVDANNDGMVDGTDTDLDGILGAADGTPGARGDNSDPLPVDTDGTDGPDYLDLDSSGDGLTDLQESGINPAYDLNNDGKVDGSTDPDGDGILSQVDGQAGVWGDALFPDLTPTIVIDGLDFAATGDEKDFVVNIFEINNKDGIVTTPISIRIAKLSAFDITYAATSGNSVVLGSTANSNSDWDFVESTNFITVTSKTGINISGNSSKVIGFTAKRKVDIPVNTSQNIAATIIYGSSGEEKIDNNIVETKITAN